MNVEVVIPHGKADPAGRIAAREHVTAHYLAHHPDWPVVLAECPTDDWSKGAAANPRLLGSDADVIVLADADSWTDPGALTDAVDAVAAGGWAAPFTLVRRISRDDTCRILTGQHTETPRLERRPVRGVPGGGIVVAHRDAWRTVNGVDPRLGAGEDVCLGMALHTLVGRPRLPARSTVLWHLWHPRIPARVNAAVWNRYRATRRIRHGRNHLALLVKEW